MIDLGQPMRAVAFAMALVMAAVSLPIGTAGAAMIGSEKVIEGVAAADDRARVMDFMAREDVRRQMIELGIDPDEATRRASSLSDAEVRQIAGRLGEMPSGQGLVTTLVGAILLVLLVLLITDLLGLTDVFPFVKSQRT